MPITLQIPDSVASGMRLPEGEIERRLCIELAIALYGQRILSFGKASELAGVSRISLRIFSTNVTLPDTMRRTR